MTEHKVGDIEEEAERNTTNICLKCYNRTILYELVRIFLKTKVNSSQEKLSMCRNMSTNYTTTKLGIFFFSFFSFLFFFDVI